MVMIIVLCILFIYLIIHQRFYVTIEGKKNKFKSVKKAVSKAGDKVEDVSKDAGKEIVKDANKIGKGFKALLNTKFIKLVKGLFTKEFLKKV